MNNYLSALADSVSAAQTSAISGKVVGVRGGIIRASLPRAAIGDLCEIKTRTRSSLAEIVGFDNDLCTLAPYDDLSGLLTGTPVQIRSEGLTIPAPRIGSVINSRGEILAGAPSTTIRLPLHRPAPPALSRAPITETLCTGVRTIDALTTLGYGQRIGLFAPAGIGKSTLLGMIARNAEVDLVVVGLVGERGREVNEFLSHSLGQAGLAKAIVVVSTSDENPMRRVLGAKLATSVAEHYRDQGKKVLLLIDSLTRMARAIRDLSLAAGEFPIRHGYTPSVYLELPKLLERAGTACQGSITGIYTLLTTHEDEPDALAEEVQSILDGHIILRAAIAQQGIWPAIDPLRSISRLQSQLASSELSELATLVRRYLGRLERDRELVMLGGKPDAELERALKLEPALSNFMRQSVAEKSGLDTTVGALKQILSSP